MKGTSDLALVPAANSGGTAARIPVFLPSSICYPQSNTPPTSFAMSATEAAAHYVLVSASTTALITGGHTPLPSILMRSRRLP